MSFSINNIIKSIEDSRGAQIKLTTKGGTQQHYECIYKEDSPPNFYLVFQPSALPEKIDLKAGHPVSIKQDNATVSLNAGVLGRIGDRTLHMVAKGIVDPASLREYFRINTSTEITVSHKSSQQEGQPSSWTISGKTQDLSGSGVLALFDNEARNRDDLVIEIYLPNKNLTVNAVGHVVRKKLLRNRKWQVSLHFDSISGKHRDALITYILSMQRKQLRENVRAFD